MLFSVFVELITFVILQNTVDKLLKDTNLAVVIGSHSWREQFIEAVTVSAGQCVLYFLAVLLDT